MALSNLRVEVVPENVIYDIKSIFCIIIFLLLLLLLFLIFIFLRSYNHKASIKYLLEVRTFKIDAKKASRANSSKTRLRRTRPLNRKSTEHSLSDYSCEPPNYHLSIF